MWWGARNSNLRLLLLPPPRVLLFFPRGETRERGASPSLPPPLTSPLFPPPREEDSGDLVRTICQRTERRKKKRRRRRSSFPRTKRGKGSCFSSPHSFFRPSSLFLPLTPFRDYVKRVLLLPVFLSPSTSFPLTSPPPLPRQRLSTNCPRRSSRPLKNPFAACQPWRSPACPYLLAGLLVLPE